MNKYSIILNTYSMKEKKMSDSSAFELPDLNYVTIIAGLGALGTAMQNYQAVAITLTDLAAKTLPASRALDWTIQFSAIAAGAVCSGLVNFYVNIELLEDFFKRFESNAESETTQMTLWEQIIYWGGIGIFVVTGLLFGAMAFTFATAGPLAFLSIGVGLFVAAIMTIQEVETWLASYETEEKEIELSTWQWVGKYIGHIIAIVNVIALSLLFSLSLAQSLIMLHVAAVPALIAGFTIAFTFGAFTEFFFYNGFLSTVCQDFTDKVSQIASASGAWLNFLTVSINALVNTALTYAGIEILIALLVASNIALPPVAVLTAGTVILSLFAGAASFILGLNFVLPKAPQDAATAIAIIKEVDESKLAKLAANEEDIEQQVDDMVDKKVSPSQHPSSFFANKVSAQEINDNEPGYQISASAL